MNDTTIRHFKRRRIYPTRDLLSAWYIHAWADKGNDDIALLGKWTNAAERKAFRRWWAEKGVFAFARWLVRVRRDRSYIAPRMKAVIVMGVRKPGEGSSTWMGPLPERKKR